MIRAIILDDEMPCIESLSIQLSKQDGVDVIQTYSDPIVALKSISEIEYDLLFLDIDMPYLNGFEFLSLLSPQPKFIIFTTAYDEYAVQAFKVNAVEYLMKPIDRVDLEKALLKITKTTIETKDILDKPIFKSRMKKIAIPTLAGLEMIAVDDIIFLESQSNYTNVIANNSTHLVSKTLKSFENLIKYYGFVRVHNSYIVNPNRINRYVKGDGGYLIMENGHNISVSRSRKEALLKVLTQQ